MSIRFKHENLDDFVCSAMYLVTLKGLIVFSTIIIIVLFLKNIALLKVLVQSN